ncbi:serine kinase [Bacillus sp. FJAT-27231]|uniref:phosphotransferase enzyme family protein n=1 Tax=Bacillus sp. FJAT-27231 TaxID=1679168 RepID=UPI00067108A9|nr:phosphotransferase [Bacillus sp. FJAT-27231]KMY53777.1 serine kinase [Bacillus sp. FJAT-27231]
MTQTNPESVEFSVQKFNFIAHDAISNFSFLNNALVSLLDYSENYTYLITEEKTNQKHILRVCRPNYHTKSQIESEMVWLKSLHEQSPIEVSLPIPNDQGEYVQSTWVDGNVYYSTLFTFLEGEAPDDNDESALIKHFFTIGYITAQFHNQSVKQHQLYDQFDRIIWDYDTILGDTPKWGKWQDGLGLTPERTHLFERVCATIKKRLDRFGKHKENFGLIHSDLRLANLIIEGEQIKVIDFDDCGFGWYLYDLATSLSFIEHKPYVPALINSWLEGYKKIRPLSEEEEKEIPTFIMMRRLQLISWVGSRDNETTRTLSSQFTIDTDPLAHEYLLKHE